MDVLPLVSVLIPAFNAERWIKLTLVSAVGQSYPRKEVIVGGSSIAESNESLPSEQQKDRLQRLT